jgi:antibiotic biosynthesis monooxygenase
MLAVTTRNVLRSARFCVPMLLARREIARQLAHQPGLLRYASGVTSPTEFFTLTVWRDREAMQRFMQSGAHEQNMWQFTRWTTSFWGMRWEPISQPSAPPVSPLVSAGLLTPAPPLAGPFGPRPERMGAEPRASGVTCVTAIFEGAAAALRARKVAAGLRTGRDPRVLRWSIGMDLPPRALAICLCQDVTALAEAFHVASWVECWQAADYEIGHWNGLRLRQVARRRTRDRVELGQ